MALTRDDERRMEQMERLFREHEKEDDRRHEENLSRFTEMRVALGKFQGGMKMLVALVGANLITNVISLIQATNPHQ